MTWHRLRWSFFFLAVLIIASSAWSRPDETGYSGAPNRGTCAGSCHGGGGGTIVISGFPQEYTPGQQYTITIRKTSGSSISNFNASCRIGTGSQNAGVLASGTRTSTYNTTGETNGIHLSSNNRDSATFRWTAPAAGTGDVRLYVAGLQGGESGTNTVIVQTSAEAAGLPGAATTPSPANGAIDISPNVSLQWESGTGAQSHDVYFGDSNNPPLLANVTEPSYNPDDNVFQVGTTYYWRIDERNTAGVTPGTLWQFTMWDLPEPGTNPQPADGVTDVALNSQFTWTAGAHTYTHSLEFGLTNPPPLVWSSLLAPPEYTPEVELLPDTVYYWRVTEENPFATVTGPTWSFRTAAVSAIDFSSTAIPSNMQLGPVYPNPFNAVLTISFALPQTNNVTLALYDILGKQVAELVRGTYPAGSHRLEWNAQKVGTGIYFLRLQSGSQNITTKVVALK